VCVHSHATRFELTEADLRNQRGPVPTEDLLEGDLDLPAIVAALLGSGYRGWLSMELWHPAPTAAQRSMVEDVRRSVAYLRGLVEERTAG
jgi:sugar phosphate isomerase/epimerase